MATTDKNEWILLDTDLTTRLAILPVGQSHLYYEINEPGSGELRIPLDTTSAGLIESGMFCQCYYRGSSRGGFFVENQKKIQADAGENGNRWLSLSGRGALALLDDAIIWDNGTTETTREFTSVTKASILKTLIDEAKARGALANLTYDFTASVDSASVAWTDSESYKLPVGTSLLDVARQFAKTGGFDYEMTLSGGSFLLSAYSAGLGTDKSETIYMRTGTNCEEVSTDERGDEINNALRVKYKAGYLTVSDSTSITNRRRREKLLSLEQAQTSTSATTYASAKVAQTKDPKTSIALRVYDGVSPRLFEDYDMGDYVMTDVLGIETRYRVLGIQADFDGADYSHVVLELNTLLYDSEMKLTQELEWLQDQWTTANDAKELETSFWAALGTSTSVINDLLYYNGFIYVVGNGQSGGLVGYGGGHGQARYEIASGQWSTYPWYPGTDPDNVTAIVKSSTNDLYLAATTSTGVITFYRYTGGYWDWLTSESATRINQMIADDDHAGKFLIVGDSLVAYDGTYGWFAFVRRQSNSGSEYASVILGLGNTQMNTVAFFNGDFYVGLDNSSGYGGFRKDTASAVTICNRELVSVTSIPQLNNCGVIFLKNYGSNLLIAYYDATNAYLGEWTGSSFTVLGTFSGSGTVRVNHIEVYLTDIYVGGYFTSVDGVTASSIAKYSGGAWSALTGGVNGTVNRIFFNDLDTYVAGSFNAVDGTLKPASNMGVYFTNFEKALDFSSKQSSVNWGDIGGTLADQTDLQAALDAKASIPLSSNDVSMPKVGTPTNDTLTEDFTARGSSGVIDGTLTYLSVGSTALKVSVAAGEGYIRTSNDQQAPLVFCKWSASPDLYTFSAPAAGQETAVFFGISYNSGTPIAISSTVFTDFNGYDKFWLGRTSYDGTTVEILNTYAHAEDVANNTRLWMRRLFPFQREQAPEGTGGLELSVSLRALAMSAGAVWHGYNRYLMSAIVSGTAFRTYYRKSGGGFNMTAGVTNFPNTQYDNGSGTLQDLTNNRYGTLWVFIDIATNTLDVVYGAVNATSVANAQADTSPSIPAHLTYQGKLIGRIIFQKSGATATLVESAWSNTFSASAVGDHALLSNLQGGTAGEYYHLTSAETSKLVTNGDTHDHVGGDGAVLPFLFPMATYINLNPITASNQAPFGGTVEATLTFVKWSMGFYTAGAAHDNSNYYTFTLKLRQGAAAADVTIATLNSKTLTSNNGVVFSTTTFSPTGVTGTGYLYIISTKTGTPADTYVLAPALRCTLT